MKQENTSVEEQESSEENNDEEEKLLKSIVSQGMIILTICIYIYVTKK